MDISSTTCCHEVLQKVDYRREDPIVDSLVHSLNRAFLQNFCNLAISIVVVQDRPPDQTVAMIFDASVNGSFTGFLTVTAKTSDGWLVVLGMPTILYGMSIAFMVRLVRVLCFISSCLSSVLRDKSSWLEVLLFSQVSVGGQPLPSGGIETRWRSIFVLTFTICQLLISVSACCTTIFRCPDSTSAVTTAMKPTLLSSASEVRLMNSGEFPILCRVRTNNVFKAAKW